MYFNDKAFYMQNFLKISGLHSNITCISKYISKIYKSFSTTSSCVMYLFFTLQFMFLVISVKQDMYRQVTKCLQLRNIYSYNCLHNVINDNTHIITNTILTGYIMACNFISASKLNACMSAYLCV